MKKYLKEESENGGLLVWGFIAVNVVGVILVHIIRHF